MSSLSTSDRIKEFFQVFFQSYKKESIANRNVLVDPSSQAILIFVPVFSILMGPILTQRLVSASSFSANLQDIAITTSMQFAKLGLLIIITYLASYKMSTIKRSGKYGYWLALGIDRSIFFRYLLVSLIVNSLIGLFTGYVLLVAFTPIRLAPLTLVKLFLLLISSTMLMVSFAAFVGELLTNAEFASITIIFFYLILVFFADDSFLRQLWLSEFYFTGDNFVILFLAQLALAIVLAYVSRILHLGEDLELGG